MSSIFIWTKYLETEVENWDCIQLKKCVLHALDTKVFSCIKNSMTYWKSLEMSTISNLLTIKYKFEYTYVILS